MGRRVRWARRGLTLLVCLTLAGPVSAAGYQVDLEAPQALRALLTDNLDLIQWRDDPQVGESQLRYLVGQAPGRVRALLETEGHYNAQVTAELAREGGAESGPWRVRLRVEPGAPTRVAGLDLRLAGALTADAPAAERMLGRLSGDWSLPAGQVFRHADWETAKRNALLTLLSGAYPAAAIADSQARVDPERNRADLALLLDSGPAFTLGELEISGLTRYPRKVIERLNPIRPGEPYSQARLLTLQSRLRDSPYFASVSVQADTDPERPERVPVRVLLEEKPSKRLGLGLGASSDAGPRGSLEYGDLNLLDRAWRLTAKLAADAKRQTAGANLELPTDADGHRDSFHTQHERTDIAEQTTRGWRLGAKRAQLRGDIETVAALDYTTERQEAAGSITDNNQALTAAYSWTWRRVDDLIHPRRGHLLSLQLGGGTRALLSDQDFLRGYARLTWFQPLGERDGLILRGEAGAVLADSRRGIPTDYLFRTGGDQSVRGYAYQSIGVPAGQAVVGGRWLAVGSAEYVHWFDEQWGGALFLDVGDATDEPDDFAFRTGYGIGARWKSPVGPLNLDLARGVETGSVRLHFSASLVF